MSYGTNTSGVISSDSTSPIDVPVNNNADHYTILLKTTDEFTQGSLQIQAYHSSNGFVESVFTNHGTLSKIIMSSPKHMVIKGQSLNGFRFVPSDMPPGLSYEILIENLGAWT